MAIMHNVVLLVAFVAATTFLQGCTFGTASEHCDGNGCGCSLSFKSFWARILIGGVHIEHSSRNFWIPDVARDVPNSTFSPCCTAIYDQIDYDEGKDPSMPNKTVESFGNGCSSSPNKDIASAATRQALNDNTNSETTARRLRNARAAASVGYQPIYDGEEGQDCSVEDKGSGFKLNNMLISSGSMSLNVKWVDPAKGDTPCCEALQPFLENVYIKGIPESDVPTSIRKAFCDACRKSPNQGIALAAYKCFGSPGVALEV